MTESEIRQTRGMLEGLLGVTCKNDRWTAWEQWLATITRADILARVARAFADSWTQRSHKSGFPGLAAFKAYYHADYARRHQDAGRGPLCAICDGTGTTTILGYHSSPGGPGDAQRRFVPADLDDYAQFPPPEPLTTRTWPCCCSAGRNTGPTADALRKQIAFAAQFAKSGFSANYVLRRIQQISRQCWTAQEPMAAALDGLNSRKRAPRGRLSDLVHNATGAAVAEGPVDPQKARPLRRPDDKPVPGLPQPRNSALQHPSASEEVSERGRAQRSRRSDKNPWGSRDGVAAPVNGAAEASDGPPVGNDATRTLAGGLRVPPDDELSATDVSVPDGGAASRSQKSSLLDRPVPRVDLADQPDVPEEEIPF